MQFEMLIGMSKGVMCDQSRDVRQLGRFGFQKFLSRRNVEEEITHSNHGPGRNSSFFHLKQPSPRNFNPSAGWFVRCARLELKTRDGCYRGQSLSVERVLQQLLHYRGRTLDYFAGGDLVCNLI